MHLGTETNTSHFGGQKVKLQGHRGIKFCWKKLFAGGGIQYPMCRVELYFLV